MNTNKDQRSVIREILFSYLVVSKVLYYSNLITATLNQDGLWTAVGDAVLTRLLTQDILIILVILLTFNTEKFVTLILSKYNKSVKPIMVHGIDYVLYMGTLALYFQVMLFFGLFQGFSWRVFLIYSSIIYLVIIAVIENKKHLKKKELVAYTHVLSADEKLAMLKTLFDNSVLTQEEYDHKKESLLSV